jgi:Tfp pilus assembly protein FimV
MFFMPPQVSVGVGKRVDRSRSLGCAVRFYAILGLAICLAGCGERSQELEERITQLQKELNQTQDELRSTKQALNATNEELARLKAASNNASAPALTPASVAQAKAEPSASASGNSTASGQRPVVNSMPADRSVTIQWPDSGRAPVPANQNPVANPGSSATGVSSQQAGKSGSGGTSNRTVVIQWPESNRPAPSTNQSGASSGAANPPAQNVQQPASSTTGRPDRTVIIQWPDSGQSPPPRN